MRRAAWFCLIVILAAAPGARAFQPPAGDPDRLYADRANVRSALDAADIWAARLQRDAADFDSAWKLSRACYWLGGHVPPADRRAEYERGIDAGRRAVAIHADRPEGHFWMAANMGAMAESFGLWQGLKYRGPVKAELETVLRLDRAYQQGSADRALGRWYMRVPGMFGGSDEKSAEHLRQSLNYDPDNAASHYFLAETYLELHRRDDAVRELQRVMDAPAAPEWIPEVAEFKVKARALMQKLGA
jgi:tetratricopeptide (TPR) repeat protein